MAFPKRTRSFTTMSKYSGAAMNTAATMCTMRTALDHSVIHNHLAGTGLDVSGRNRPPIRPVDDRFCPVVQTRRRSGLGGAVVVEPHHRGPPRAGFNQAQDPAIVGKARSPPPP